MYDVDLLLPAVSLPAVSLSTYLQLVQLPLLSSTLTTLAVRCHPSHATQTGR
jgi:hypothetical protein